ncbi:hypothetical protein TMU01_16570 [Tenuibacillus multivorans]|nr:hypothetical protein TMU01_16570 [Tenuibacillus multivorans]
MKVRLTDFNENWSRMFLNEAEFLKKILAMRLSNVSNLGVPQLRE